MNAHEQLDRILQASTGKKIAGVLAVALLLLAVLGGVYWLGKTRARDQADSDYLRQRDEALAQVAIHENAAKQAQASAEQHLQNEKQLAAENALLKKQNEAQAEILTAADTKLAGNTTKFTELQKERQKQYETIDADNNFDSQLCAMCRDAESSGFRLSANLCGRCKANP